MRNIFGISLGLYCQGQTQPSMVSLKVRVIIGTQEQENYNNMLEKNSGLR